MHCVHVLFCSFDNPFFRVRLQILLKMHRFIGSEPYPLPSPSDLRAQAGLLNFWKLGGQSRRVKITVTLTQALINQHKDENKQL